MKVYVFGNGNIPFDYFTYHYEFFLNVLLDKDEEIEFIVCDFRGADTLAMEVLKNKTENVSIYHIGDKPRYLPDKFNTKVSQWEVVGGFKTDLERDNAAIVNCTHFLAKDFNSDDKRKSGTKKIIERCLELGKIPIIE